MVKRKDNVASIRSGIVVAVLVLVAALAVFGLYYGLGGGSEAPFEELDRPGGSGDVEVVSFFSYTCPHCRSFEQRLADWYPDLPEGATFKQLHITTTAMERLYAKAYFALERARAVEANHERIFDAYHDRNRRFASEQDFADFVDGHGVDRETFLRLFASPAVARRLETAEQRFRELQLAAVPALVVDDKYVINMASRKLAIDAAEDLVARLIDERDSSG